jgi:hypothetical protein
MKYINKKNIMQAVLVVLITLSFPSAIYAQVCGSGLPNCPTGSTCQATAQGLRCVAQIVHGQGVPIAPWFNQNFTGGAPNSIGELVSRSMSQIYTVALIITLFYLIWGAYKYMMSGGDPKAVGAARAHLTWAIAGIIIVYLSYFIFQLVNSLLGKVFDY